MDESSDELKPAPGFEAFAFSLFAGLALLMAATGIYGVLSQIVTLRSHSHRCSFHFLVVREAFLFVGGDVSLGLRVAILAAPQFKFLLFNVNPSDPFLPGATCAVLFVLALLAALASGRGTAQQGPAHTLRAE